MEVKQKREIIREKHWATANGIERKYKYLTHPGSRALFISDPKKRHISCSSVGYGAPEHQRVVGESQCVAAAGMGDQWQAFCCELITHRIAGNFLEYLVFIFELLFYCFVKRQTIFFFHEIFLFISVFVLSFFEINVIWFAVFWHACILNVD